MPPALPKGVLIIAALKQRIIDIVEGGAASKDDIVQRLVDEGARKRSVQRTISLLVEAGQIEIEGTTGLATVGTRLDGKQRVLIETQLKRARQEAVQFKKLYEQAQETTILQDMLKEAIERNCQSFHPVVPEPMPMPDVHTVKEMACLHVGDWHADEVVTLSDTGGISEYDRGIMIQRAQNLAETVNELCYGKLQGYSLNALAILMLGDFVSTNIHNILANAATTPVDSMFLCSNVFGQFLIDLARRIEEIHVFTVPGNHGRLRDDVEYKMQHANWDNLFYHMLRVMLKDQENIHFHISKAPFTVVRLNGWRWLLYHGGNIRTWSGIPFYGIIRAFHSIRNMLGERAYKPGQREYSVNKLNEVEEKSKRYEYLLENKGDQDEIEKLRDFLLSCTIEFADMLRQCGEVAFDYIAMGHFHTSGTLDLGSSELFMNGSAIGPTDYAVERLFRGCRPRHWLHGIHHKRGATWRYPVILDDIPGEMKERYKSIVEWELENMWMPQEEVAVNV